MLFFEKQFGEGEDPWYEKAKRWVKKKFKNPFVQHLGLGFIEWLKQIWIEVKVANTMRDVDRQSEQIKKIWEEQDERREPIIVEKEYLEMKAYRNFKPDCWRRVHINWHKHGISKRCTMITRQ